MNDNDPTVACVAVHAELNAAVHASGGAAGSTCYSTHSPCFPCSKALVAAGVVEVVAATPYPGVDAIRHYLRTHGVRFRVHDSIEVETAAAQ